MYSVLPCVNVKMLLPYSGKVHDGLIQPMETKIGVDRQQSTLNTKVVYLLVIPTLTAE
jgi:hypothetical protein